MDTSVICISHSTGARGDEVGRRLADDLRMRYLDEEIVSRAAAAAGVSPEELRDAQRRRSALERLFRAFGESALSADGYSLPLVADQTEAHRALINEAINAAAEEGNAVIVSHAASITLGERSNVLRVLVTASAETRIKRIAADCGGEGPARDVLRKSDAGRAAYLKSLHGVSQELPTHYDLVVNTDKITVDQASELVAALAGAALQ